MTKQDFADQLSSLLQNELDAFIESLHNKAAALLQEFNAGADYSDIDYLVSSTYINGEAPAEKDIVEALGE